MAIGKLFTRFFFWYVLAVDTIIPNEHNHISNELYQSLIISSHIVLFTEILLLFLQALSKPLKQD